MKKLCVVMSLALCLIMSACSNAERTISEPESQNVVTYSVKLDVDCVENLFFSRYDVNVFVDGKEVGTLDHGSQDSYNVNLPAGRHSLSFEKEDDSSIDGSVKFDVSNDTSLKYKISCTMDQISVAELTTDTSVEDINSNTVVEESEKTDSKAEEPVLSETQAKIPKSSYMYSTSDYKEVVNGLKQAGFTNIKTEAIYNADTGFWGSLSINEVDTISVSGKTDFNEGDVFEKNCEILIKYCDLEINNPNIKYNSYTVAKLIQDLESNALTAKEKHTYEYVQITGRIDSIDASGKNFYLYPSNNEWALQGVLCNVQTDDQKEKLKTFSTGNTVTVKGKITLVGEILGYSLDIYGF